MSETKRNRFDMRLLFGLLIVVAGVLMLLERLGLGINVTFHTYWPMLLIVLGIGKLVLPTYRRHIFSGIVLILVGVVFQLRNLGFIFFHVRDLWPLLFILVGLSIVCRAIWPSQWTFNCDMSDMKNHIGRNGTKCFGHGRSGRHGMFSGDKGQLSTDILDISVVFGGGEYTVSSQQFQGGNISATFGGIELDLREAEMAGDCVELNINSSFGSVELRVPAHWLVVLEGSPTLGCIENKTISPQNATKKLVIKGAASFGNIEVGN